MCVWGGCSTAVCNCNTGRRVAVETHLKVEFGEQKNPLKPGFCSHPPQIYRVLPAHKTHVIHLHVAPNSRCLNGTFISIASQIGSTNRLRYHEEAKSWIYLHYFIKRSSGVTGDLKRPLFAVAQHAPASERICILCASFASSFVRRAEPESPTPANWKRVTENTTPTCIWPRMCHHLSKCVDVLPPASINKRHVWCALRGDERVQSALL